MKPAIFTVYPYPKQGGCFRQLLLAMESFADNGCDVHYLSAKPFFGGTHPHIHFHKFPFYFASETLFYAFFYALGPLFALSAIAKNGIKHILVFNEEFSAVCALSRIVPGVKITLLIQGSMEHLLKSRRPAPPLALMLRICGFVGIRAASRVFAVSRDLAERSKRYYGFRKEIAVFPNYPRLSETDGANIIDLQSAFGVPRGSFVAAYTGSLIRRKNIEYLLREFAAAASPDKFLILIGDGPEKGSLLSLARSLGIAERVVFSGARQDRLDIMKSADLFVLPSLHDDCPVALLEALALGNICFASKRGGIPEILLHDELMFDPCREGGLGAMLGKVSSDKGYAGAVKALCSGRSAALRKDWPAESLALIKDYS